MIDLEKEMRRLFERDETTGGLKGLLAAVVDPSYYKEAAAIFTRWYQEWCLARLSRYIDD